MTGSMRSVIRPRCVPDADELAHLALLGAGAYQPLRGFLGAADTRSVIERGRLTDGTSWPVPVTLRVPADVVVGDEVDIRDPEGAPLAVLDVEETWTWYADNYAAGPVRPMAGFGLLQRLRRTAAEVRSDADVLGMVVTEPLHRHHIDALNTASQVLLLPTLTGPRPAELVRAVLAAAEELTAQVVPIELPNVPDADRKVLLQAHIAAAYGATRLLAERTPSGSPIPTEKLAEMPASAKTEIRERLQAGLDLPPHLTPAKVAAELRRSFRAANGFTVLFTGLSGAGKSTIARALRDELLLRDPREVSLLDGDLVRRHLSAGLGFSPADRSRNVRRVGWVAAEITKHGGIAVCPVIAPYAADRIAVRDMVAAVGGFLLVHVATPLDECERRDRKGLYAQARAGLIDNFTGISAEYEVPTDADLVLDTVALSVDECVCRIVDVLAARGWLL